MLAIDDLVRDYGAPQGETRRCRQAGVLFDFCCVYRVRVAGRDAIRNIENFQSRILRDMAIGQIRYSVKSDAQGRVRSDFTLWRCGEDVFEIMSGCREDSAELAALKCDGLTLDDLGEATAILARQEPDTLAQLAVFTDVTALLHLLWLNFTQVDICGISCLVGRLGYSWEAGFELLVEQSNKDRCWALLAEYDILTRPRISGKYSIAPPLCGGCSISLTVNPDSSKCQPCSPPSTKTLMKQAPNGSAKRYQVSLPST